MKKLLRIPLEVLIAVDQLVNTLLLGSSDETLSARAYRTEKQGLILGKISRPIIDLLFFFDTKDGKGHCQISYEREMSRYYLPEEYRN